MRPFAWLNRITGRGPNVSSVQEYLRAVRPQPGEIDQSQMTVDDFHRLYYDAQARTWKDTWWMGIAVLKLPLDLWLYQEFLNEIKPDVIIECGTYQGGSALYLAHVLDLLGHGEITTIDVDDRTGRPQHPRITYVLGSSTDPAIVADVAAKVAGKKSIVILDSDHMAQHVYDELVAHAAHVSVGSYMIVEDTNVHGHPVRPTHPPGPAEGLARFLAERDDFIVEPAAEKFFLTFNPGGVLRRVR